MPRALAVILLTIVSVISLIAVTGFTSVAIESTEAAGKLVPIEKQAEQTALYREIFDRLATRHHVAVAALQQLRALLVREVAEEPAGPVEAEVPVPPAGSVHVDH